MPFMESFRRNSGAALERLYPEGKRKRNGIGRELNRAEVVRSVQPVEGCVLGTDKAL